MASLCSLGSSYVTNCVEGVCGHAAARVMANDKDLVNNTLASGFKFLTHASIGYESREKPFRWMYIRRVDRMEIIQTLHSQKRACEYERKFRSRPGHSARGRACVKRGKGKGGKGNDLQEFVFDFDRSEEFEVALRTAEQCSVWHSCVQEMGGVVVTSYFWTNLELVMDALEEKFSLLREGHDDDPLIIKAALADEAFVEILKMYFESGDMVNPKYYKTLATFPCCGKASLLHHCCEHDLVECVRFLLSEHSGDCHPREPWLQLADPLWQENRWGNTAFSVAAYRHSMPIVGVLLDWIMDGGSGAGQEAKIAVTQQVLFTQRDKKGLCVVESLLKDIGHLQSSGYAQRESSATQCLGAVADFLVRRLGYPMGFVDADCGRDVRRQLEAAAADGGRTISSTDSTKYSHGAFLIIDAVDSDLNQRRHFDLMPCMTLAGLTAFLEAHKPLDGDRILISKLQLSVETEDMDPSEHLKNAEGEPESQFSADCWRFFSLLKCCSRISFKGCHPVHPEGYLLILQTALRFLGGTPDHGFLCMQSLMFDIGLLALERERRESTFFSVRLAEALKNVTHLGIASFGTSRLSEFHLTPGLVGFLPETERSLISVTGHVFWLKRYLWFSCSNGKENPRRGNKSAANEVLHAVTQLERKLLQRPVILRSNPSDDWSIVLSSQGLHESWKLYVRGIVTTWCHLSISVPQFLTQCADALEAASNSASSIGAQFLSHIDEALTYMLKLRPKGGRPGLEIVPEVLGQLPSTLEDIEGTFPQTARYIRERGLHGR